MRFEYAILGLVAIFSFVLLVSTIYPDSISANAITTPVVSPGKAVAVQQPSVQAAGGDIIQRQIFADLAALRNDVSELNSRLGQAETCCQEARQDISIFGQEINDFNIRLTQLEQRVTQAGGQEAPAIGDMFDQCQMFGTGASANNCNAACASLRKTCVVALHEGTHRAGTKEYSLASCSETAYRDDQWTVRFTCYCC